MSESERIPASEWILQNPENYLHIYDPIEGEEALKLIQGLLAAGAVKVEVTKEHGYSDDGEEEREQLYVTLPVSLVAPMGLILELLELNPTEFRRLDSDPYAVLRLWWDNH